MGSWAVDFATNSAHGGGADPLIQKLFRIFLVFTDELDATDLQCNTYKQCIERRHKLSVDEVRALCALLTREIGLWRDMPSTSDDAEHTGTVSWPRAGCACCDMVERIGNYPEYYNFKEFIWTLGRLFPDRLIVEAAVDAVFQRICNQIIQHGFVYVYRKQKICLRPQAELVWCTVTPGRIAFYPVSRSAAMGIPKPPSNIKEYTLHRDRSTVVTESVDVDAGTIRHMWTVQLEQKRTLLFACLNAVERVRWVSAVGLAIERAGSDTNVYRPLLHRLRRWQHELIRRVGPVRHDGRAAVVRSPTDASLDIDGVRVTPPKAHTTTSESIMQEVEALRQQLQLVQQSAKDEEIVRNLATRLLEEERAKREVSDAAAIEQAARAADEQRLRMQRERVLLLQKSTVTMTRTTQEIDALREQLREMHEAQKRVAGDMLEQLRQEQKALCAYQRELQSDVGRLHRAFGDQLSVVSQQLRSAVVVSTERARCNSDLRRKQQLVIEELQERIRAQQQAKADVEQQQERIARTLRHEPESLVEECSESGSRLSKSKSKSPDALYHVQMPCVAPHIVQNLRIEEQEREKQAQSSREETPLHHEEATNLLRESPQQETSTLEQEKLASAVDEPKAEVSPAGGENLAIGSLFDSDIERSHSPSEVRPPTPPPKGAAVLALSRSPEAVTSQEPPSVESNDNMDEEQSTPSSPRRTVSPSRAAVICVSTTIAPIEAKPPDDEELQSDALHDERTTPLRAFSEPEPERRGSSPLQPLHMQKSPTPVQQTTYEQSDDTLVEMSPQRQITTESPETVESLTHESLIESMTAVHDDSAEKLLSVESEEPIVDTSAESQVCTALEHEPDELCRSLTEEVQMESQSTPEHSVKKPCAESETSEEGRSRSKSRSPATGPVSPSKESPEKGDDEVDAAEETTIIALEEAVDTTIAAPEEVVDTTIAAPEEVVDTTTNVTEGSVLEHQPSAEEKPIAAEVEVSPRASLEVTESEKSRESSTTQECNEYLRRSATPEPTMSRFSNIVESVAVAAKVQSPTVDEAKEHSLSIGDIDEWTGDVPQEQQTEAVRDSRSSITNSLSPTGNQSPVVESVSSPPQSHAPTLAGESTRRRLEHVNAILLESMSSTEAEETLVEMPDEQAAVSAMLQSGHSDEYSHESHAAHKEEPSKEELAHDVATKSFKSPTPHMLEKPPLTTKPRVLDVTLEAAPEVCGNETSISVDVHVCETLTIRRAPPAASSGYASMSSSVGRRVCRMPTGIDDSGFRSLICDSVRPCVDSPYEIEPLTDDHLYAP